MDDDIFLDGAVSYALSEGTCEMATRALKLERRPTPPEIRAAARFFPRASWRAVAVLTGWGPTADGSWKDMQEPGATWAGVAPAVRTPRAVGPGSEWWNQELAALAIVRTICTEKR